MRRNSLAFRLVAGAAVWCALWLSAGGYALSALFGKTVERNFDARLGVLIEGLVAGSELNSDGELELRLGKKESDLAQYVGQLQQQMDQRETDWWSKQLGKPVAAAGGE